LSTDGGRIRERASIGCSAAGVRGRLEDPRAAGVDYVRHRYLAHHGFANETAVGPGRIELTQYDATWAQMAWDRSFRFFGRHLG
jgi:carboxymethylenebutenolidase